MNFKRLNPSVIYLDSVDSTNSYASNLIRNSEVPQGTVISALRQSAGKGQRGNSWLSEDGKNLVLSIVIYPAIKPGKAFSLNMASALAVQKTLSEYVNDVKIKWPNDVLIGTKKIAGILVENQVRGSEIATSVIGIGININQENFGDLGTACSLKSLCGQDFNREELLGKLLQNLDFYINLLMEKNFAILDSRYHEQLYGMNKELLFEDKNGTFTGMIKGIDEYGRLMIACNGNLARYDLKEIRFLL